MSIALLDHRITDFLNPYKFFKYFYNFRIELITPTDLNII